MFPICYGIAAFGAGGQGVADSVTIENPRHLNLAAYAVTDANNNRFVTIINKEHSKNARDARVRINTPGGVASVIYLEAPDNDVAATSGITLGGATIDSNHLWQGTWKTLNLKGSNGCELEVVGPSAAIVKIQYQGD
jgi:hypothetical protein